MSQAVEKRKLSASDFGDPVWIEATSSPGTIIHESSLFPNQMDEIWLYIVNRDTATITITVEHGNATWPVEVPPYEGAWMIMPGFITTADRTGNEMGAGILHQTSDRFTWTGPDLTTMFAAGDWVIFEDIETPMLLSAVTADTMTLASDWLFADYAVTTVTLLQCSTILLYCDSGPAEIPYAIGWVNRITEQ